MENNKKTNLIRGAAVGIIVLIVFNFIVFLLPAEKNGIFWVSYVFGILAILLQALFAFVAFKNGGSTRSRIYGLPIINIGITYGALQLVLSFVGILLSRFLPFWLPFLVYVILLGGSMIGTIAADAVKEKVEFYDQKIVSDTKNIRMFQSKMEFLLERAQYDAGVKKAVSGLYDAIRYSDPVSSDETLAIEANIGDQLEFLQRAIQAGEVQTVITLSASITDMVKERNSICAEYKYRSH